MRTVDALPIMVMAAAGDDDDRNGNDEGEGAPDAPPRGFGSIEGRDGVMEDRVVLPDSVVADYRKIEDPTWLERELLRPDDGYPTSRGAVMRQAFSTGDVKGFSFAVSSVDAAVVLLILAYVTSAAARVGTAEGEFLHTVGEAWKFFLPLGVMSAAVEVQKFVESVIGVEGRRKM